MEDGNESGKQTVDELAELRQRVAELERSAEERRALFGNMQNGFALHEIVLDESGKPVDYVFLDVNPAFEAQTGLRGEDLIGKRVTEALPGIERDSADWIGTYGEVALTGKSISFEDYPKALRRWYAVTAYRPREGQFAVVFTDITERKQAEDALQEAHDELEERVEERTARLQEANVSLSAQIAERKQAEEALREQARLQEGLLHINRAVQRMVRPSDLGQVMLVCLSEVRKIGMKAQTAAQDGDR